MEILLGIIESRKVQFNEISLHIQSEAKVESTESRVQAFFRDFEFDYEQVARILICLLPNAKLTLCMDRTEWDFGAFQCTILVVTAYFKGVGIPIFWELLDNKSGNSHTHDRIDLFEKCIHSVGKNRIARWIGDREFIGHTWLKYLKDNEVPFCVRVPKHHKVQLKNGDFLNLDEALQHVSARYYQAVIVDGIRCNLFIKKLPTNELFFLIGSEHSKSLGTSYRQRWSIEVCFQSLKGRGFNLEETHLKDPKKLKMLLVFVSLALLFCVKLGILVHAKKKTKKVKKDTYKTQSFFRVGLDVLRTCLKHNGKTLEIFLLKALEMLEHFLLKNTQLYDYQRFIKNIR